MGFKWSFYIWMVKMVKTPWFFIYLWFQMMFNLDFMKTRGGITYQSYHLLLANPQEKLCILDGYSKSFWILRILILQSLNFHIFSSQDKSRNPSGNMAMEMTRESRFDSPFFHGFSMACPGGLIMTHYQLAGSPFFNYFEETHQHIPIQLSHSHVGRVISHSHGHVMWCFSQRNIPWLREIIG